MRPIFNEKVTEKCNLWVRKQCMEALFTEDLVNNCGLEKKEKKKKRKTQKEKTWMCKRAIQTHTLSLKKMFGVLRAYVMWKLLLKS